MVHYLSGFRCKEDCDGTPPAFPFGANTSAPRPKRLARCDESLSHRLDGFGIERLTLLSDADDAMTRLVAEKIIELAQRGLKNPTALQLAAIEEFKSDLQ